MKDHISHIHSTPTNPLRSRWFEAERSSPNEWNGKCEKCQNLVPAIDLELRLRPFGKGEWWVCKGGCESSYNGNLENRELLKLLRQMQRNGEI